MFGCQSSEIFQKKTEFLNSRKTHSDSKTDSKVWLKVRNAGPYNIELTSCLKWLTDHKCNLECRLWQHTSIQRSRTGFFCFELSQQINIHKRVDSANFRDKKRKTRETPAKSGEIPKQNKQTKSLASSWLYLSLFFSLSHKI